VWSWFEQAAAGLSQSLSDAGGAASSAWQEAARYASAVNVSEGLVRLPRLLVPAGDGAAGAGGRDLAPGAAWSSSSWGALTSLPAYLKAVAMHAAPDWTPEEAQAQLEERGSIFAARRKGEWMGCTRPYYLVCKGVYRSIKRINALTVLDAACVLNAHWLPLVLHHLRKEFRLVQLVCADRDASRLEYVKAAYEGIDRVTFTTLDPFRDEITNQTDLVIGVKLLDKETMIRAMKFFNNMRRSAAAVSHIVYENYPNSRNRWDLTDDKERVIRLNTMAPPFMFGQTAYRYESADEQPTSEVVEIMAIETKELFANKETPTMSDLEDPKLRKRRQEMQAAEQAAQ
jgi:hypothetical protein